MKIDIDLTDYLEDYIANSQSRRWFTAEQRKDEVRQLVHAAQCISDSWGDLAEIVVAEMGDNAKEYLVAAIGND